MKDWLTDEERAALHKAEMWTRLHALAVVIGLVALIVSAVGMVLS